MTRSAQVCGERVGVEVFAATEGLSIDLDAR
jgi:hypothetical protein